MKRKVLRIAACLCAALIFCFSFSVCVSAQQAYEGETVALRLYISGVPDMASYSAYIKYDASRLIFKEKEIPYGTVSFNFAQNGIISIAVICNEIKGMDFSDNTLVCTLTFDALTDIEDMQDLFNCKITEAINLSYQTVDEKCITAFCAVSSDGKEFSTENEIYVDKSELASSTNNNVSAVTDTGADQTDNTKESKPESHAESITSTYAGQQSELDGQPAIRFDTSTPNVNSAKQRSMIFIGLGLGFFLVSIVGIVLISVKNKK